MNYPYKSHIYLAEVVLNVQNLERQTTFYHQILGLEILLQTEQEVILGRGEKALVHLRKVQDKTPIRQLYGLYHMALLLPSRQDLADILKHLLEYQIPLVGGADHGYSEAIYLEDLEGNGIEIYWDKPVSEWDIREDGRIIGVTEELDAQSIYELGRELEPFTIAAGTRMGHIHLSVNNGRAASQFYQAVLGLSEKFSLPSASWLASGAYHHHLAVNEWGGPNLEQRQPDQLGLAYFTAEVTDKEQLVAIHEQAQTKGGRSEWLSSSELLVTDQNGLAFLVRKVK